MATEGAGEAGAGTLLLRPRAAWLFLAGTVGAIAVALAAPSSALSSFAFDVVGLAAGGAALVGLRRNRPPGPDPWTLVAAAIVLSAAGDVVYDLAVRRFGAASGFPYADTRQPTV